MSRRHVLVVDDEPGIRLLVHKLLEPAGYRVSDAADGQAALNMVKSDPPDVVLLDLEMPVVTGHEVLAALKADKTFKAPVMVLTAQTDWKHVDASISEGADAYMTKPFTLDQLQAKLLELLGPQTG